MDGPPTKPWHHPLQSASSPYMFLIFGPPSEEVNSSLEVFLTNNAPSKITKQQAAWIRVFKKNEKEEDTYSPQSVGNIIEEWRSTPDKDLAKIHIIEEWRSMPDKDLAKVHNMAEKYQMTTGKEDSLVIMSAAQRKVINNLI